MEKQRVFDKVEPVGSVEDLFAKSNHGGSESVTLTSLCDVIDGVDDFQLKVEQLDDGVVHLLEVVLILLLPLAVEEEAK